MTIVRRCIALAPALLLPFAIAFAQDTGSQDQGDQPSPPIPATATSRPAPQTPVATVGTSVPAGASSQQAAAPSDIPASIVRDAGRLDRAAAAVESAVNAQDTAGARQRWSEFDDAWFDVEDGFRAGFPTPYRQIEGTMGAVSNALRPDPISQGDAVQELGTLRGLLRQFLPAEVSTQPVAPVLSVDARTGSARTAPAVQGPPTVSPLRTSTPTIAPTTIPLTCSAPPSLTLGGSSVSSEGVLEWRAVGLKPSTTVEIAILGPSGGGPVNASFMYEIEEQVVGSRCEAMVEASEWIRGFQLREANAPTGQYVIRVRGVRNASPGGGQDQRIDLFAPFNYYVINR